MLAIFNSLGGGEVIAILVIALIVLGPEKLPEAIRKFGNIYGELRRMSQGFQSELRDAFDEPMRELRGTAQMFQDAVHDPVRSITADMKAPAADGGATPPAPAPAPEGAATTEAAAVESDPGEAPPVDEHQAPVEDGPSEAPAGPSAAGSPEAG